MLQLELNLYDQIREAESDPTAIDLRQLCFLHAIAAVLIKNGKPHIEVEPVHTLGWTAAQVKQYMREMLRSLSGAVGEEITKFEAQVKHVPETCQIEDCPLKYG